MSEVGSTLSARIEPLEKVNVLFECCALFLRRLVGKSSHGGVKKLPGCATKFCSGLVLVSRSITACHID